MSLAQHSVLVFQRSTATANHMETAAMLRAIADSPIVSTDTLRPDHLCSALIAEADRLELTLDRDLWQPAAAIAAHGMRGVCLELPPRLQELSAEIISELLDALNWHAPSGCSLGASEGDGACFLWTLTLEAQAEAINSDLNSKWEAITLDVPQHWLSAIVNGDESSFDYYDDPVDHKAYKQFCAGELSDGWSISAYESEGQFSRSHDATAYGVKACAVVQCLAMRQRPAALCC
jgi:hypothetical protein